MPPDPQDAAARANVEAVTRLLAPLRGVTSSPGVPMVQDIVADPGGPRVYFDVVVPGRRVRVEVQNKAPGEAAFLHTDSFTWLYQLDDSGQPGDKLAGALSVLSRVLRTTDRGGLALRTPATKRGGPSLLKVYSANETRAHRFGRDAFDRAFAARSRELQFPLDGAILVISQPCEMQCSFCPSTDRDKAREDWVETGDDVQLADLLHQARAVAEAGGAKVVELGGNDVLRFSRVVELAEGLGRLGFERALAQTPGLALESRPLVDALAKTPLRRMLVPLYGRVAAVHDRVTGTPGAFDRLCRALDNALAGGLEVELHTIALGATLDEVPSLLAFARERWGLSMRLNPLRPNRLGEREHLGDFVPLDRMRAFFDAHPDVEAPDFPLCVRGVQAHPAPRPGPWLNLYDLGMLGEEHARIVRDRTVTHPAEPCDRCAGKSSCFGVLGWLADRGSVEALRPLSEGSFTLWVDYHDVIFRIGGVHRLALLGLVALLALSACRRGPAVEAEPAAEAPRVEGRVLVVTPAFVERSRIVTGVAKRAPLTPTVRVVGTVTFDPEHVAAVGVRSAGFVRRVLRFEGDAVTAGEPLAEIESNDLRQAVADTRAAAAHHRAAVKNADRERDLLTRGLTTAREAEVAEATREEHEASLGAARARVRSLSGGSGRSSGTYLLRAPIAGTVVARQLNHGMSAEAHTLGFRVADLDHLWVELAVSERRVGQIRVGDRVNLTPQSETGVAIEGKVAHVGEVVEELTRSADVRVEVDNRGRALRPGQSVVAELHPTGETRVALVVPRSAVTFVDGKPTVFSLDGPGRLVAREVVLGAADGAVQEVKEGLTEGVEVVVEGVLAVKSELYR